MAVKKRMLADVPWEAANEHLDQSYNYGWNGFSCCAVAASLGFSMGEYEEAEETKAIQFLRRMGCDVSSHGNALTVSFEGHALQGARYMWLLLAMHVAEDEGIEIEVAA